MNSPNDNQSPFSYVWVTWGRHELLALVHTLFTRYQEELGIDLCFQGFQEELITLPGKYGPPSGALLLMTDGSLPVACGAIHDLGDGICEMKRLYVEPEFRGHGIARKISFILMERAVQLGYETMRLDTLRRLTSAMNLYASLGFKEIAPYNFNPEDDIVYFERPLPY